jgi:hypothetical protein
MTIVLESGLIVTSVYQEQYQKVFHFLGEGGPCRRLRTVWNYSGERAEVETGLIDKLLLKEASPF